MIEKPQYDLVIVGAGCVGMAMAYTARKAGKTVLLLQKQKIRDSQRYWSSSFSARQNRVQYTESYLTNYVIQSNGYWDEVQAEAQINKKLPDLKFRHTEGGLWFGDKNVTSSEGNIFESNNVLDQLDVDKLYMESLLPNQPTFFKNFKFTQENGSKQWAALFQPDGGSINMEASYTYFLQYCQNTEWTTNTPVKIEDEATQITYSKIGPEQHQFTYTKNQTPTTVSTKKIFLACGNETSEFVKNVLNGGTTLGDQGTFQEYVASYFQITPGKQDMFKQENFPSWIEFLNEGYTMGYGFPFHTWDNPVTDDRKTIKLGTMEAIPYTPGQAPPTELTVPNTDPRVVAAKSYVEKYMNNLEADPVINYRCPIVFYDSRETVCDYLNRTEKDIVVQTGGWIGKYYPLLASSSYKLLFTPEIFDQEPTQRVKVEKTFLNRTSYPIRKTIQYMLSSPSPIASQSTFDTIVVGAGVSGLYSTMRILQNEATKTHKIAVFDMLDRIAGRLWTVNFKGSSTPMELGGMRYIEGHHHILTHQIKELHIPSMDFDMTGSPMQNYLLHAYLRNDRYRQNEWEDLQAADQKLITAYRIDQELIGMNAYQMICYSAYLIFMADYNDPARKALDAVEGNGEGYYNSKIIKKLKDNTSWYDYSFEFTLKDWNIIKPHLLFVSKVFEKERSPQPLFLYGFQNVIENQFSHEAYTFIAEQNGYFSNTSNASYLEQVMTYVIDFGDVKYKTLSGGFDMLCYTFANQILNGSNPISNNGGGIYLQNELRNIETGDFNGHKYKLTFRNTIDQAVTTAYANKIILGMPRRSVEILKDRIDVLQKPLTNYVPTSGIANLAKAKVPKSLTELISTTQSMPAIKIIMNFRENWWDVGHSNKEELKQYRSIQQMRGVSCTDMPIRQALYFGTNNDNFLLASYNDMITTEFWSVLQNHFEDFYPIIQPTSDTKKSARIQCLKKKIQEDKKKHKNNGGRHFKITKSEVKVLDNIAPASVEVVREIVRQLSLLHGKKLDVDSVKQAMYQNWGNDPFGGGYHNWFSGWDIQAVMKCIRKPWAEDDIFIVGQAFSNLTGWIEGALQTTQHMLQDQYSIPPSTNAYIGY